MNTKTARATRSLLAVVLAVIAFAVMGHAIVAVIIAIVVAVPAALVLIDTIAARTDANR